MNSRYDDVPAFVRSQLKKIVEVIVRSVGPEKVILFGINGLAQRGEAGGHGGVDLLIVTKRGDRRPDHELQDLVESRCRPLMPVNLLIHDIDHVNARLREGHYFFALMSRDSVLVYDARVVPLAEPGKPDLALIREVAERDYEKWDGRARAFYKSALMNLGDGAYRVSVFLLHQAAEHIYQAILLVYMGYKPCTHNLDKLRRHTNRLSIELAGLFPRDNEEEDRIFRLLLLAYVEARYKDEYTITEGELRLLCDRVGQLLEIAARLCKNRFLNLAKMAAAGVTL